LLTSPSGITLDPSSPSTLWIVNSATTKSSPTSALHRAHAAAKQQRLQSTLALATATCKVWSALVSQELLTLDEQPARASTARSLAADHVFDALFGSLETPAPKRARRMANVM